MLMELSHRVRLSALAVTFLALTACGGGGDSGSAPAPAPAPAPASAAGYTVRVFNYTDANNYMLRFYYSSNVADASGMTTYYDQRVGRVGGVPTALSVLYDTALYATPTGWRTFNGTTANTQTAGSPYTTVFGGYTYDGTSTTTDVAGLSIASVVAQTQALGVNTASTMLGVSSGALTGNMPAGAALRRATVTSTVTPVQYRVSEGSVPGVSTLAALVAAYPVPALPTAVNTASMARLHSPAGCTVNPCLAEGLRVAFGPSSTASYYLCDYDASNGAMSNCAAAGSGTYALGVALDGVTPIMSFSGLPASTNVQTFTRVFVQRNGVVYYGWKDKIGQSTTTTRLNKIAFEAVASQLGITVPTIDATPSAYIGTWGAAYAGGDTGSCTSVSIDATGYILGSCTSTGLGGSFTVSGRVSSTGVASFTASGGSSSGASFSGSFTATSASGTWTQPSNRVSGTWLATKL